MLAAKNEEEGIEKASGICHAHICLHCEVQSIYTLDTLYHTLYFILYTLYLYFRIPKMQAKKSFIALYKKSRVYTVFIPLLKNAENASKKKFYHVYIKIKIPYFFSQSGLQIFAFLSNTL